MKLLCISDTHNKHLGIEKRFGKLPDADVIIHAGDISGQGHPQEVENFLEWFSSLKQYNNRIFIAGNHDFLFENSPSLANSMIPENVIYLNDSGVTIDGKKFWGSPVSPRFFDWAFNRDRGEDIKKHWDKIPNDTDVLITHSPPKGYGDYVIRTNEQVGCEDLLLAIHRVKPIYNIFGHIHQGYGMYNMFEQTTAVNVSVVNESYMVANPPVLLDL